MIKIWIFLSTQICGLPQRFKFKIFILQEGFKVFTLQKGYLDPFGLLRVIPFDR